MNKNMALESIKKGLRELALCQTPENVVSESEKLRKIVEAATTDSVSTGLVWHTASTIWNIAITKLKSKTLASLPALEASGLNLSSM